MSPPIQAWLCGFKKPETEPTSLSPSTTVLSPYLKFGCLSVRTFWWWLDEVYQGVRQHFWGTGQRLSQRDPA